MTSHQPSIEILVVADGEQRQTALRQLVGLVLPQASMILLDTTGAAEGRLPAADVALADGGTSRSTLESIRVLRARGFTGGIVVLSAACDDPALEAAAQSFDITCITRSTAEQSPVELGAALTKAMAEGSRAIAEVVQARRIFAAGQAALSLQHSINNPLAALLAEAQLLQLEELGQEQREAVDRMIELCRRVIALVRRLDALGAS
jgi:signal transduction histidine kinase